MTRNNHGSPKVSLVETSNINYSIICNSRPYIEHVHFVAYMYMYIVHGNINSQKHKSSQTDNSGATKANKPAWRFLTTMAKPHVVNKIGHTGCILPTYHI